WVSLRRHYGAVSTGPLPEDRRFEPYRRGSEDSARGSELWFHKPTVAGSIPASPTRRTRRGSSSTGQRPSHLSSDYQAAAPASRPWAAHGRAAQAPRREDAVTNALADYLTLACTGTGQATFYNAAEDQERALEAAHAELLRTDRRIYGLTAALPVNDRSR